MPDIKTREKVKGTVKTLDKAAVAGERMKAAYVRTKEKAEQGIQPKEDSPEKYAADRISAGSETVAHEAVHQFDKQGRKGVQETKENISKAKQYFEQRRADQPKKQAQKRASENVRRSANVTKQSVKSVDYGAQSIKTVERGEKQIRQTASFTGKACVRQVKMLAKGPQKG